MRSAGSLNSDSLVMGFYKTSVPSRADHRAPSYWYAASSFLLQEMPTVRATQGIRQLLQTGSLDLIHDEHLLALLPMPLHKHQEKSMAPNRVRSVTRRYTSFENGHGPVPGTWRTGGPSPFPFDKNVQFSDDGLETMLETCWRHAWLARSGHPFNFALRHIPSDDQSPKVPACESSFRPQGRASICNLQSPQLARTVISRTGRHRSGNCVNAPRAPEAVHCGKASGGTKGPPSAWHVRVKPPSLPSHPSCVQYEHRYGVTRTSKSVMGGCKLQVRGASTYLTLEEARHADVFAEQPWANQATHICSGVPCSQNYPEPRYPHLTH
ncbi:hypothetical protein CFAM422_000610 [Trichoderma lentiforme]|nr:hypothetical protein CFAM422_000610 [Trichoderma lentiforme]